MKTLMCLGNMILMHNSREQQTKLQALLRKCLFARLLSDDAVVGGQVLAVDFDNALELARRRLDDGRVDETKEVAKGTGARGGQSVQGPALDEALVDDGVHAVGLL